MACYACGTRSFFTSVVYSGRVDWLVLALGGHYLDLSFPTTLSDIEVFSMAQGHHHIIPLRTLSIVFAILLVLTVVTVITARIDLGALNVPLALSIAGFKAILVAMIFMALKYDNKVNLLAVVLGVVFVVVFLALTFADTEFRGNLGITEPAITEPVSEPSDKESPSH